MNRTFVRVLSVLLVLGLTTPVVKAAEEHDKSTTTGEASAGAASPGASGEATRASSEPSGSTRAEAEKSEKFPAKYDELISKLDKEIEITAVAADKEENNRTFKVGGENKALLDQIKALKDYRDKLKNCAEDTDKKLAEVLDNYIFSLLESLTVESRSVLEVAKDSIAALLGRSVSVKKGKLAVSEKVINTYTLQIRDLLDAKAKKHEKSKADFEAQDKALSESLNKVAAILWNSKEEGKFREKIFTADKAKEDESTKAIVEAVDKIKASLDKSEKVCKLASTSTDTSGGTSEEEEVEKDRPAGSKEDEAGPDKGTGEVENPAVDPGKDGGNKGSDTNKGGTNTGGTNTGGAGGGDLAGAIENALNARGLGNQGFGGGLNELQAALAALEQAKQFQELQRQADQAAIDALRDNNDFNNDALGRALQALGQQEAPSNRSANRENTEGSPSISPSIDSGKGGGQPNIPPPPPMQQPPPAQPFPFQALQPPPTQPINFPAYGDSKKWDDEPTRRPPVVVPDPNMSARLELEKMKLQLAMAQQQQMMYGRPMTGNVNNVGGRLAAFGARGRTGRVAVRTSPSGARINGTASAGKQANMATGSRTRAPK